MGPCIAVRSFGVVTFNACFMSPESAPELLNALSAAAGKKVAACLQEVDRWVSGLIHTQHWGAWQVIKSVHKRGPALAILKEVFVGCKDYISTGRC